MLPEKVVAVTPDVPDPDLPVAVPRVLPPAAQRALAEAAERRRLADLKVAAEGEQDGRGGLDPVRFGDWEKDGLAIDF
jgi:hypothetical protein